MPQSHSPTSRARFRRGRAKPVDRPIHHIEHGIEILEAIDQISFATNEQMYRLFFANRSNQAGKDRGESAAIRACQRSLNKLWKAGYVDRRPIMLTSKKTGFGYQSFVSVVTSAGADDLRRHFKARGKGELRWTKRRIKISNKTIEHSLAINDFYVAMRRACEEDGIGFYEWKDDRQLTAMSNAHLLRLVSIPDAFFVLEKGGNYFGNFAEIDLGTESGVGRTAPGVWLQKIIAYGLFFRNYYSTDNFFKGYTAPIVHTVTDGQPRLDELLKATKRASGAGVYWHTALQDLSDQNVIHGRVWRVVNDRHRRSIFDRLARGNRATLA